MTAILYIDSICMIVEICCYNHLKEAYMKFENIENIPFWTDRFFGSYTI